MGIEWNSSYSIGVEEIDSQHKELFLHFNNLLAACNEGRGNKEVFRLFKFLDDYVVKHFNAEEKLQRDSGYPHYELHKLEHEKFKHQLQDLEASFTLESQGIYLVITTNKVMVEWLIQHILKQDKDIASYLEETKGVAKKATTC